MRRFFFYPNLILINFLNSFGKYLYFIFSFLKSIKGWKQHFNQVGPQVVSIGINSIPIVIITSLFSGMVIAVQAAYQYKSALVPQWIIGSIVGKSVLLELGPVITSLVMAGKVGAAITAEIGSMRVSEQIDALESLSFDPICFLVMPRILASIFVFPLLIACADIFGILGGYLSVLFSSDLSTYDFIRGLRSWFHPWDAWFGVIKGLFFGISISSIACFFGFFTKGGTLGLGKSTTQSVVVSCISILILDYFLSKLLL